MRTYIEHTYIYTHMLTDTHTYMRMHSNLIIKPNKNTYIYTYYMFTYIHNGTYNITCINAYVSIINAVQTVHILHGYILHLAHLVHTEHK